MSYILLRCKECGSENEIYCDGDNAMFCPDCQSVDCFEEVEEDEFDKDLKAWEELEFNDEE